MRNDIKRNQACSSRCRKAQSCCRETVVCKLMNKLKQWWMLPTKPASTSFLKAFCLLVLEQSLLGSFVPQTVMNFGGWWPGKFSVVIAESFCAWLDKDWDATAEWQQICSHQLWVVTNSQDQEEAFLPCVFLMRIDSSALDTTSLWSIPFYVV